MIESGIPVPTAPTINKTAVKTAVVKPAVVKTAIVKPSTDQALKW
jgi:hypothetical protein